MSRSFFCQKCGSEIIVKYLMPGEPALCQECGELTPVPESAREVETLPGYLAHRFEPSETQDVNGKTAKESALDKALTRERNIFVAGFVIMTCLSMFLAARLSSAPPESWQSVRAVLLLPDFVAKVSFIYLVYRLSRFLSRPVWLTALYCVLVVLSLRLVVIPFIGLLIGVRNARQTMLRAESRNEGTADSGIVNSENGLPDTVRVRTLVIFMLLVIVFAMIAILLTWPRWPEEGSRPMFYASFCFIFELASVLMLFLVTKYKRLDWKLISGIGETNAKHRRYVVFALPLVALSAGTGVLIYIPLSLISPGIVERLIIDPANTIIWTGGDHYVIANILIFLSMAVIGPVTEEFLFRGLILSRWSIKWNVRTGIILSSLCFAFLHADVIGAFFFAYVMSILYMKTRSLLMPILIHMSVNTVGWLLTLLGILSRGTGHAYTLTDFRNEWMWGVIGLLIGLPWLVTFLRHNRVSKTDLIPIYAQRH